MAKLTLPSLKQLFTDAWALTKARFWSVLLLWLIQGLIVAVVVGGLLIALLTTSLGTLLDSQVFNAALTEEEIVNATVLGPFMGVLILVIVIALLAAVILGPFMQASTVALIGSEKPIKVGAALRIGLKKFVSVMLVGLMSFFFVFGGLFLFLIPGLVIGVLFSFAMYEIVLGDATPMQALRTSAGMVWQNFWAVVGRMLALMALGMLIGIITEGWAKMDQSFAPLINMVLNAGYSIFAMMYSLVLYRQLKASNDKVSMNLTPIGAISILGWLVLVIILRNIF
jgi:uncharacterized membrane protein